MFRRTVKIVFFILLFIEFSVPGFAETKKEYYSDNKLEAEWQLKNGKLDVLECRGLIPKLCNKAK